MSKLSNAGANAAAKAATDLLDVGSGSASGSLAIYGGTPPAGPDAALSANPLLAALALSRPAFAASATPGKRDAAAIQSALAGAAGTATFFRFLDRDGNPVLQGTVTATGGGGDLELDSVNIAVGAQVSVTAYSYVQAQ